MFTESFILSLHDAVPISVVPSLSPNFRARHAANVEIAKKGDIDVLFMGDSITDWWRARRCRDRKSTRLNSSHTVISYAVFCLKKKNIKKNTLTRLIKEY